MGEDEKLSVPALLAVLDERTERILITVEKLERQLTETCLKLAKTEEVAQDAKKIANKVDSRLDQYFIGGLITFLAAIGGIVAGLFKK